MVLSQLRALDNRRTIGGPLVRCDDPKNAAGLVPPARSSRRYLNGKLFGVALEERLLQITIADTTILWRYEMDRIEAMTAFVGAVDESSMAGASHCLGCSPAAVTPPIFGLERLFVTGCYTRSPEPSG